MTTRYGTRNSIRRKAATAAKDLAGGTIAATTTQVDVTAQGDVRLQDAAGGEYVALQAPSSLLASYTLTFPANDGDNEDVLTTNGSGVLTWEEAGGGGGGGGAVSAVANGADNRISTFSSTTALNGEANLTFDGSALTVAGEVVVGTGSATGVVESNGNQDVKLRTGNSTTGNITITDGAHGNIALTPNGTGKILVGSGAGNCSLSSSGAHDLVLETNSGTNAGTITLTDGADGHITLAPNGDGLVTISSPLHTTEALRSAFEAVTINTALDRTNHFVQASRSTTMTLSSPSAETTGLWFWIGRNDDDTSDGMIEIEVSGDGTIDGELFYHLEDDGDAVAVMDNGTEWRVLWEKKTPRRAGFDPDQVENLAIWLSGGTGITTDGGGDITQWADQSGNNNHAAQLGSVAMPTTATVNSITVPAFTAGDVLNMTTNILAEDDEPWTTFVVINTTGSAPANTHIFGTGSHIDGFLYQGDQDVSTTAYGKKVFVDNSSRAGVASVLADVGGQALSTTNTLSGTEVIIASYYGQGLVKLDGGDKKWFCSHTADGADYGYTKLNIGASSGSTTTTVVDGFTGNICEVIVYQRALDHSEIVLVRQYLERRWA